MNDRYKIIASISNGIDNFSVIEYEFKTDIVDKIMNFALDCQYKIIAQTNCECEDIFICIPNYLLEFLKDRHRDLVSGSEQPKDNIYLCGMKCQFSFDNSVTVFYNAYIPTQIIKYTQEL